MRSKKRKKEVQPSSKMPFMDEYNMHKAIGGDRLIFVHMAGSPTYKASVEAYFNLTYNKEGQLVSIPKKKRLQSPESALRQAYESKSK